MKAVLLLALVFLSGCSQEADMNSEEGFEKLMMDCKDSVNCKDGVLIQYAINMDDISYCDSSSNLENKNLCASMFHYFKARKLDQKSQCNFIEDSVFKNLCLDAVQTKD